MDFAALLHLFETLPSAAEELYFFWKFSDLFTLCIYAL